ncbi:MAG: mobile mystery protein B [Bacteroidota bacterium]
MGLDIEYISGQTPLDEDETQELLIPNITTRGELDEFEQQNIETAIHWTLVNSFRAETVLSEEFIRNLHERMFGNVWRWAGEFRLTNKNIGVDKFLIGIELRKLLDDCEFWIDKQTYPPDEIAVRLKHRLVSIHCFPNGNGRHARLAADVLVEKVLGQPVFTWGRSTLRDAGAARTAYISALKIADKGDLNPLILFARS